MPPPTTGRLQLHIEGGPADRVSLDGHEVARTVSVVDFGEVMAGTHLVTIEAAGRETQNSSVTITGGAPATLSISLPPAAEPPRPGPRRPPAHASGLVRAADTESAGAPAHAPANKHSRAEEHGLMDENPVPQNDASRFARLARSLRLARRCAARAPRRPRPRLRPGRKRRSASTAGLRLFNQGENAGALVEFKRTYELTGDPVDAVQHRARLRRAETSRRGGRRPRHLAQELRQAGARAAAEGRKGAGRAVDVRLLRGGRHQRAGR